MTSVNLSTTYHADCVRCPWAWVGSDLNEVVAEARDHECPKPIVVVTFEAQHPGECPVCTGPIRKGQRIARLSDEALVHAGCVLHA
jgi:hypothetical protein